MGWFVAVVGAVCAMAQMMFVVPPGCPAVPVEIVFEPCGWKAAFAPSKKES